MFLTFTVFLLIEIIFLCEFSTKIECSEGGSWTYDDVCTWPGLCSTGRSQSPINIDVDGNIEIKKGRFNKRCLKQEREGRVINNGKGVSVTFPDDEITVASSHFHGDYLLDNIHFHWGSEHTLNGIRYPMEIHLVFFDKTFTNISEALKDNRKVAVLGVLVEATKSECIKNSVNAVASTMNQIRRYNNKEEVPLSSKIKIIDFLPKFSIVGSYLGSLTTPECDEGIQWFVMLHPLQICTEDVKSIRTLYGENGCLLKKTYRPVQDLNGRKVAFSKL